MKKESTEIKRHKFIADSFLQLNVTRDTIQLTKSLASQIEVWLCDN